MGGEEISHIWSLYNNFSAGKGMIMLLSGPPGVGKTLTAESGMFSQLHFSAQHL